MKEILSIMKENQLYAKRSKCAFAQNQVEYLGHVVTSEGVVGIVPPNYYCMYETLTVYMDISFYI